ncbi:hypothetical protein EUX98_g5320 [Antrodiella citrinella]|uniref:carnosine N-methyltransferase n=1 Tax=Antrodiella citrinella TaxID=2447956 RepID=A0A4S4MRU7_9APHY|nr:hypothetical protein EUX98_g5320 [Antrodiella citrinella]
MVVNPSDVEEEHIAFTNVVTTFRQYAPYALSANNRRRKDLFTLPSADRELLEGMGYKEKLVEVDKAIMANAQFLSKIVDNPAIFGPAMDEDEVEEDRMGEDEEVPLTSDAPTLSGHSHDHSRGHTHSHSHGEPSHSHSDGISGGRKYRPSEGDMEKLRSTIKQFVRDWSVEGKVERDVCYEPMKESLLEKFSDMPFEERHNLRVLVPGAGLGRLAWDVASLGFSCQGNEFSHYMLLASFFILNRTEGINQHVLYPYVHSFSNIRDGEGLLRPVFIPDVSPSALPPTANFSLVAGDFEEIYGGESDPDEPQAGHWDAILTCFFIDTAKNIVNYLRIIHRILAPGGVWINLGPLLWHWENNSTHDPSVELSLEEVKTLARAVGFDISNERTIDTTYTNNTQSMLGYVYHAAFWTATKIV